MELPELHLDHLTGLQTLVLEGCSPRVLRLTGSCALNLIRAGFNSRELERLPKNINYINFSRLPGVSINLPAVFPDLSNLYAVFLRVAFLGSTRSPVSLQPLAHVSRLHITGGDLFLKISSNIRWQSLTCKSSTLLEMSFENVHDFAHTVSECCIGYSHLRGPGLVQVCSALRNMGTYWSTAVRRDRAMTIFRYPVPVDSDWRTCFCGTCYCGACLGCLKRDRFRSSF